MVLNKKKNKNKAEILAGRMPNTQSAFTYANGLHSPRFKESFGLANKARSGERPGREIFRKAGAAGSEATGRANPRGRKRGAGLGGVPTLLSGAG